MARIIKENSFEGAPGGSSGTMNYSVGYGTPAGGNISQAPSKFDSSTSNKASNDSENTGSVLSLPTKRKSSSGATISPGDMALQGGKSQPGNDPKAPNTVGYDSGGPLPSHNKSISDLAGTGNSEDYYPNGGPDTDNQTNDNQSQIPGKNDDTSPGGVYQNAVANKDAGPDNKEFDKDVDKIFQKKVTPTPDELLSALQYELTNMVKKDKYIAKSIVLKNLQKDPKYYSRLNMLNIDDEKMDVHESQIARTKAILDTMIEERQKRARPVQNSPEINQIFEEMWQQRRGNPSETDQLIQALRDKKK